MSPARQYLRIKNATNVPLAVMGALLLVGGAIAVWFGTTFGQDSTAASLLFLGVAAAAMLIGGLAGFLFGLPRFKYDGSVAAPKAVTTPSTTPGTTGALPTIGPAAAANANAVEYRPSTNLDDVADWLTKIIVGVGLVQVKELGHTLADIAHYLAAPCGATCSRQEGFLAALIVYTLVGGFLFGYIWTRLQYGPLAARSDIDIRGVIVGREAEALESYGVGGKGAPTPSVEAVARSVAAFSLAPVHEGVGDPNKGRFGGKPIGNGRVLRGTIEPAETGVGMFRLQLTVSSTNPANPLLGSVTFYLHPTFKLPTVVRPVENGIAVLTVVAWGAFTVGAMADGGATRLELDLAENPDAPDDFKSN
jgi:pYEATS domain-containing protein involved in immunity